MPTYIKRNGRQPEQASSVTINLPDGLDVRTIRIRHGEIVLHDAENRESVLIQRGTHPGAGLSINFADHVTVTDPGKQS